MTSDRTGHSTGRIRTLRGSLVCLLSALVLSSSGAFAQTPARDGKWVEANGVMLRYEVTGAGDQTVVMLHDMGLSLEMWDEVVPAIQRGRKVVRYDLRGFGLSEKFRTPSRYDDYVADLGALLDALKITKPVVLVGESISGGLALKFASLYPQRVKAVVAINPVIMNKVPAKPKPGAPLPPSIGRDTPKLFETEGVRAYLQTDAEWLYPARLRTPERWNRFMGMEASQDPSNRAIIMRMPIGVPEDDLTRIKVPVLFIAGMINNNVDADRWREIQAETPGSELTMIDSAHHAAFETPELVNPHLLRFLKAHP